MSARAAAGDGNPHARFRGRRHDGARPEDSGMEVLGTNQERQPQLCRRRELAAGCLRSGGENGFAPRRASLAAGVGKPSRTFACRAMLNNKPMLPSKIMRLEPPRLMKGSGKP